MPQHIRVFLSSPGDVTDERALAGRLLKEKLPYDPFLRGRVSFDLVSWDDPMSPTPMPATITPQEAVNRFGPKPSECDVVVVVLWSRLGTHLDLKAFSKPDGEPYLSGTEWEFEDAWNGWKARQRPEILVYRRTEEPKIGVKDPNRAEKFHQYDLVERFFECFKSPDGSLRRGWTPYDTSTGFESRLQNDLKHHLFKCLDKERPGEAFAEAAPNWAGSPYPGLRPFTPEEAPIFFGRGREVDALLVRLREPTERFLTVVGASGSGKSSLLHAGLLPRLADGALEGSRHWSVLAFTPGAVSDDPFTALAVALDRLLPSAPARRPADIAKALAEAPESLVEHAAALLAKWPADSMLVLFIDQLEELFTAASENHRRRFINFLAQAANDPRLRVLATMRADFLPQGMADPVLAPLLQTGSFLLGPPGPTALTDMIRRPAEQAGLTLEDALADQILRDAGGEPGEALPLVAFCLEALYRRTVPSEHRLTLDAYRAMGGLRGAIGRRADEIFEKLGKAEGVALDAALPQVFRALVHVDAAGKAARQRASRDELMAAAAPLPRLIETLDEGRLLLAEEVGGRATFTLAHEALLEEWPALREWVGRNRARMQRIQRQLLNLASPEAQDRQHAAETLGRIEPAAAEAVPALTSVLRDTDEGIRRAAAEALGRIGPVAVPELLHALRDTDEGARRAAVEALGWIGPAAVPALATALRHANEGTRRAAVEALGRIGRAAAPALADALRDSNEGIREAAAENIGWIGPSAAETVPALATALSDTERRVRRAAIDALRRIGPAVPAVVPALTAARRDSDAEVGRAAAEALRWIGPGAETALLDVNEGIRRAAVRRIGPLAIGEGTTPPIWDLFDLYPSPEDPALAADLGRAVAEAKAFAGRLSGTLAGLSGDALAAAIADYERIEELLGRATSYAQLVYSSDSLDPANGRFSQTLHERVTSISSHLLFFTLELNQLEQVELDRKFADSPALGRWRPWLRDLRVFRPHQLSDELERLFHEKDVTGRSAWNRLFDETISHIKVPVAGRELSVSVALDWLADRDRATRAAAAKGISEALGSHIWLFSLIFNTNAKDKEIIDTWRKYPGPCSDRNRADMVEDEVVNALVAAVVESYPRLSHRYYLMKARWLGLPRLQHWDRNAPLPEDDDRRIAWGDAVMRVLEAHRAFSPELAEIAQPFFSRHWIHAAPGPGKPSGAFAHPTVPSVHPYLLLSYHGTPQNVMTLGSMLGHGVHQTLAGSQGYLMAGTPLILASTASGFSEILTFRAMLNAETDPRRRRTMLAANVEGMLNTVVRQTAYYRFETLLHNERRKGELSPERIAELWLQVQADSVGPAFELTPDYGVYWAYIPHFVHTPFCVYAYAFGVCLVNALYGVYREGAVPDFERKYIEMLRAGGTKRHRELLAPFGLDASDPGSWRRGLDVIASFIDELEHLDPSMSHTPQ